MYRLVVWLGLFFLCLSAQALMHDPTMPPSKSLIQAIIISQDSKIVQVDGKRYSIGDEILGGKIVAINSDSVKIKSANEEIVISMHKPLMKEEIKSENK